MSVVEVKNTAYDELTKELNKKHQKNLELSQQISNLNQEIQDAKCTASSVTFREGAIRQELELAKRNNEWMESELKAKSSDAMRYRKEKGAQIAELQHQNEELISSLDALKKTNQVLRARVDELQKKADESLTKIQQLQEEAATAEDGFRQELDSSRRLAELQSQQTQMHRNRLLEVEADIEKVKENAAEEAGRCRAEVESERKDREFAENRIAELESEVDRLETMLSQDRSTSGPETPRHGLNGSISGSFGSPTQIKTPSSVRNRSIITATQAIEELGQVKIELKKEKLRAAGLEAQIDQMVEGLEAKKPYIDDLELENKRLELEMVEMSKFVDQLGHERDNAVKDARKSKSEATVAQAECNILGQQLRDLSSQIKMFLADQVARDQGWDDLSAADKSRLENLAMGMGNEGDLDELSPTDRLISQRLVVFRNVNELQQKNQEQLKIIRQLGAQMESEEALAAKHQASQDHEMVKSLQAKIESYKDELNSLIVRSESYIKERDMFRRMLQNRGQIPANSELASLFGQSCNGNQNGLLHSTDTGDNKSTDLVAAIRNLQAQYDQYRQEQATDRKTLKEQVTRLSQEKSALQAEVGKIKSQLTLATDRFDLLNSNYAMLGNENKELQKRSQTLSEAAAKQDLRTQQVAEDLVEAKYMLESIRNENSNLRAEKKLWKDIQDRLSEDNNTLMNERTRLNSLVTSQQNLQNERELSDSENRRRLQSQIESLEIELNTTKKKLNEEMEDGKKLQLRKEYDSQQNQKRIDDLTSSLSHAREELIAVKTSNEHLKSRVEELTIELKSSEERVHLLQPRAIQRTGKGEDCDENFNREQELLLEISELKRDLELAKSEFESINYQAEQYKSIAQSTEEEIQNLNSTSDQFREEMDRIIQEKDNKIREFEQRAEDISAELTQTNNELTNLRKNQGEVCRKFNEDRVNFEAEIARLKDEEERYATATQFHLQDLRAQAEIATKAQQDYENELVKHADAAKQLQSVRAELHQLKTETAALKSDAESSRATLRQNEISWEERCEQFEKELKELRDRRDDLTAQNKVLYQQLENVTTQISSLQQKRASDDETGDDSLSPHTHTDRNSQGLRELNLYLRREKEIIEVQYELKVQEAKRLLQQLEYAQSQLDDTRLKLDQERRFQSDKSKTSITHKDLMEKLNELNLYRESSTTLRNELRQTQSQLVEKSEIVENLLEKIQPLETRIRELEHVKESLEGEIRLLQEDRDRWQKRTQDIISKYDRIDPVEMEQLRETIESLRVECDALREEKQPMIEKISSFENERNGWVQSKQKLIEQAKERNRINTKDIKDRTGERDAAIQEKNTLQEQLSNLQHELEVLTQDKDASTQQISLLKQELEIVKSEREKTQLTSSLQPASPSKLVSTQETDGTADEEIKLLRQEVEKTRQEKLVLQEEVNTLRGQLETFNSQHDGTIKEASETRLKDTDQSSNTLMTNANEESQIGDNRTYDRPNEAEKKEFEEKIRAAEAKVKEFEKRAKRMEEEMETKLKKRSDTMKTALNKKLAESKQSQRAELEAEYKLKLEQEKRTWIAESNAPEQATTKPATEKSLRIETELSEVPPTPNSVQKQSPEKSSLISMSEDDARQLCQSNKTIREIIKGNIMSKLSIEIQKLKDEHAKIMADYQQKADTAKTQAVSMETKKSALKINMTESRARIASGKLHIVELAAEKTPERAVGEVWIEVKDYKPPPIGVPSVPGVSIIILRFPKINILIFEAIPPSDVKIPSSNPESDIKAPPLSNPSSTLPNPTNQVPVNTSNAPAALKKALVPSSSMPPVNLISFFISNNLIIS